MKTATLDKLIWTLIYGGLLVLSAGLFVQRAHDPLGWTMVVGGGVAAVAGAVLIWVRSKVKETP